MNRMTLFVSSGGVFFRKSQTFMKAIAKELGFSFLETIILVNVCENPGATQETIAHNLVLDNAAVARSLKQLEYRRLIRRVIDPNNQRKKKIYALSKGETSKKEIDRIHDYWNALLLSDYSQQEQKEIMNALQKLHHKAVDVNVDKAVQDLRKTM